MSTRTSAVDDLAAALAPAVEVDEERDLVRWRTLHGTPEQVGLHDYAALYAVPGLYEAVYYLALGGRAPRLVARALADVVPADERAGMPVLDVGAGTGGVGEALRAEGFSRLAATDLEPASALAVQRDRPGLYGEVRTVDLVHRSGDDDRWLAAVAPRAVTVAGAVGFGHLPVEACAELTGLLPPGGLMALTAARDLDRAPELAGHCALLLGPAYEVLLRRDDVHRYRPDGTALEVAVLVLRRTGEPA